jgi:hypothetical protein
LGRSLCPTLFNLKKPMAKFGEYENYDELLADLVNDILLIKQK